MNNVFKFTANLIELAVAIFGLLVVLSLLVGFDVIEPTLAALSVSSNLLIAIGIFVVWAVSKEKIK
jgi:hypothetical protein